MTQKQKNGLEEHERNAAFIREKIGKKPVSRRKRLLNLFSLLLLAAFMGAAAAAAFVLTKTNLEQRLTPEEPKETVVIPKDEETWNTETAETASETAAETEAEAESDSEEAMEEQLLALLEEKTLEIPDYKRFYSLAQSVWREASKSFVTVTTVRQDVDWFDHIYVNEGQFSGIILEINQKDILILTEYEWLKDSDELEVMFYDGSKAAAELISADSTTGIAVLGVAPEEVGAGSLEGLAAATLGNSFGLNVGSPVIAAGAPYGMVGSMAMGTVVYSSVDPSGVDTDFRVLYTDLGLPEQAGGFLLNPDGEIVALLAGKYGGGDDITTALGISSIKGILENLCNGRQIAYLGVEGQAVTAEIAEEYDLPEGIYVTEAVQGSPAYRNGIQRGDVITEVGTDRVTAMRELHETLLKLDPGQEVEIHAIRGGIQEPNELTFQVTLQNR